MSDTQVAPEADQYAAYRMAATAAAKAKRLWPDVIGEVLADEVLALMDLPSWLCTQTRTQRLIEAILSIPEGAGQSRDGDPPGASEPDSATRDAGASRAA